MKPMGASRLVVKKDETTSGRGLWRLAWDNGPDSTSFVYNEGECSARYYRTKWQAVAAGEREHGITAVRAEY